MRNNGQQAVRPSGIQISIEKKSVAVITSQLAIVKLFQEHVRTLLRRIFPMFLTESIDKNYGFSMRGRRNPGDAGITKNQCGRANKSSCQVASSTPSEDSRAPMNFVTVLRASASCIFCILVPIPVSIERYASSSSSPTGF